MRQRPHTNAPRRLPTLFGAALAAALLSMGSSTARATPLQPHELSEQVFFDRSGAPELIITSAGYGAVEGLLLTQTILGADTPWEVAGGLVLGAGAGVVLPLVLTWDEPVHVSQAMLYSFAERWGLATGGLLPFLWSNEPAQGTLPGAPAERRQFAAASAALSLGGLGLAIWLHDSLALTPGQISALGSGQIFGGLFGDLLMLAFDQDIASPADLAAPTLLFSNLGILGAYLARDALDVSRERMLYIDAAGFGGLLTLGGLAFAATANADFRGKLPVLAGSMLTGMVGGLVGGYFLTRGVDEFRQGVAPDAAKWGSPSVSKRSRGNTDAPARAGAGGRQTLQLLPPAPKMIPMAGPDGPASRLAYGADVLRFTW